MAEFYKLGVQSVLQRLGLQKDEGAPLPAAAAGAIAAGTPFLGLIGEKPLLHDPFQNPNIPRAASLQELAGQMKPGDVLVSTRPGMNFWKAPQLFSGGSELYHTVPVVDAPHGKPRVYIESDALYDYQSKQPRRSARAEPWDAERALRKKYPEAVVLRPNDPLTEDQLNAIRENMRLRARRRYDIPRSFKNWFRDIFLPKIETLPGKRVCKGDICSTLPLQARHEVTGFDLGVGKKPKNVLPADWLRSTNVTPVSAYVDPTIKHLSPRVLKALRLSGRAALGAGLGLGTYGLLKHTLQPD